MISDSRTILRLSTFSPTAWLNAAAISLLETERPNEHVPACQKLTIHIVVEDGRVQAVYANCPLAQVDAEVLDLDDAKVSDDAELESVRRSIAEAAGRCTKIY